MRPLRIATVLLRMLGNRLRLFALWLRGLGQPKARPDGVCPRCGSDEFTEFTIVGTDMAGLECVRCGWWFPKKPTN